MDFEFQKDRLRIMLHMNLYGDRLPHRLDYIHGLSISGVRRGDTNDMVDRAYDFQNVVALALVSEGS